MKGYKVFSPDWTCRGFQYKVGETFRHNGEIEVCKEGFHFCKKAADCFDCYAFNSENKVAEIEATGNILTKDNKSVTDEIKIVKELSWHEVLDLVNIGKNCTGLKNTGSYNSGVYNSGAYNSGTHNSGGWNSGGWNSCNYSTGFFNSVCQPIYAFNKPLSISREEFLRCYGMQVLNTQFSLCKWVYENDMTDKEKKSHPEYECTGGYLKTLDFKTACKEMWDRLTAVEKQKVREIPNFDPAVFEEITGIDVTDKGESQCPD